LFLPNQRLTTAVKPWRFITAATKARLTHTQTHTGEYLLRTVPPQRRVVGKKWNAAVNVIPIGSECRIPDPRCL
jgi:hypothetical protein